jgi:hypothetical protein
MQQKRYFKFNLKWEERYSLVRSNEKVFETILKSRVLSKQAAEKSLKDLGIKRIVCVYFFQAYLLLSCYYYLIRTRVNIGICQFLESTFFLDSHLTDFIISC